MQQGPQDQDCCSQYALSFHLTLGKVLVQVESEPSAAEAKNLASLRQQA